MINEELTFKEFGYYSYDLKPKSQRKVIAVCDCCGKARKIWKQAYKPLCGSCVQIGKPSTTKGRVWVHNKDLDDAKMVTQNQLDKYLSNGWVLGMSDEAKKKLSISHKVSALRGKASHFYIDGRTKLHFSIKNLLEYKIWRKSVFARDKHTCQDCFERGGRLDAHHYVKRFAVLVEELLSTYPQFSPIEDKETLVRLAITYAPFWEVSNGKTLCRKCHKIAHRNKTVGVKDGN